MLAIPILLLLLIFKKISYLQAGKIVLNTLASLYILFYVLWGKIYPSDENNFTKLALRCLLVESGDQKILIETGIGNHYREKKLQNNGVTSVYELEKSLIKNGISSDEITDVFLTHLHWDHCTGAVKSTDGGLQLTFQNANIRCGKTQWEHTKVSNIRERTAYHREALDFMFGSGKLNRVEKEGELFPGIEVRFFDGHTPGQMLPFIRTADKTFVYTSGLVPTAANISLLWIASYDLDPVKVMEEKQAFLVEAAEKNYNLFFEHDYYTECATVKNKESRIKVKNILSPICIEVLISDAQIINEVAWVLIFYQLFG